MKFKKPDLEKVKIFKKKSVKSEPIVDDLVNNSEDSLENELKNKNVVSMVEKVKFWEEQDRINKSIIPRVLKNHELIIELTGQISEQIDLIVTLKEDNKKLEERITDLESGISPVDKKKNRISYILSSVAILVAIIALFFKGV